MRQLFEVARAKTHSDGNTHLPKEVRELLWLDGGGSLIFLLCEGEILVTTHERISLEASRDPSLFIDNSSGHPTMDVARLTGLLGIQRPQLARVLGLPWSILEADPFGPVTQAGLKRLYGLLQSLREHKPTWRHIRWWLHKPLAELGGASPLQRLAEGRWEEVLQAVHSPGES